MGRRGPAPKPTHLKLLEGVDKKNPQRVNRDEPRPSVLEVAPPEWLDGEALEIWEQYAPDLERKGVLKAWDCEEFAQWCDAAARRRRAVRELAESGEVIKTPVFNKNGEVTGHRLAKSPWMHVLNEADAQVLKYGSRFGMTPSDRAQLTVGDGQSKPGEDLLTG